MTPKFSLVTAVAGAALLIAAVPAWGQSQLPATYPDVVERATAAKIASESTTQLNLRAVLPSDSVESAIGATEQAVAPQSFNLRTVVASDSVESATGSTGRAGVRQETPQWQQALIVRSEALNSKYGLGAQAQGTVTTRSPWHQALIARSEALNRKYGLGAFSTYDRFVANDNRFRVVPSSTPTPVSATGSGREIEWPQIGIGFGIGILLALGLMLTVRLTRVPPIAH